MRRIVQDVMSSLIPQAVGLCASDLPGLLSYINPAVMNLTQSGGETGWWGSWDRVRFNVNRLDPFIVTPYPIARIINLTLCRSALKLNNSFFEVMEGGLGWQERDNPLCRSWPCAPKAGYDRLTHPFSGTYTPGATLRVFPTNAADVGKRMFFNGIDTNLLPVNSVDNGGTVPGIFVTLDFPYVDVGVAFDRVDSVVKDLTLGMVAVYQVNADASLTILANYGPTETNPSYRKYFITGIPNNCCGTQTVAQNCQVEAMCKLEFTPLTSLMDSLIIGNLEALRHECLSIRFSQMDATEADSKSARHHAKAISILQHELDHYLGKERPAVVFNPMGSRCADSVYTALGSLI